MFQYYETFLEVILKPRPLGTPLYLERGADVGRSRLVFGSPSILMLCV